MILKVENVKKTYRGKGKGVEALKEISLEVGEGEIFGFVGPNGAGKTTLIKIIVGILNQDHGKVRISEKDPRSPEGKSLRGFVPENPQTFKNLTGEEFLKFCAEVSSKKEKRVDPLLELVGLKNARKRRMGSYSKGMIQRTMIAQSLLGNPPLLVYDEPLSGLDPIGRRDVKSIIRNLKEEGKTVFFSSHIIEDVEELVDRVAIIKEGKITKILELGRPGKFLIKYFTDGKLKRKKIERKNLWKTLERIREIGDIYEVKPAEIELEEIIGEENN